MPASKSPLEEVVARWRSSPRVAGCLVDVRELPGRPAVHVDIPQALDPRLVAALWDKGITRLYSHQAESIHALAAGFDVVAATPTASGKSLCYQLPVFDALLRDPKARALYLFPTKALARDQVEAARALAERCTRHGGELGVAVYDGDTPPDQRRAARNQARIVATNPDMLHAGILPHHAGWAGFLSGLEYVVVDELHVYRGLFGAGVANVLRRLRRICAFYGASPKFVATSATIANPGELGAKVLGSDPAKVRVISESGAPSGPRTFVMYNPPVIDSALGLRGSYLHATKRLTRDLIDAGVPTLVFARSRRAVEILVRYLRDAGEKDAKGWPTGDVNELEAGAIRGYRGGYLPDRRREVEKLLREGETSCVVATSALELGIDVGGLDAVVISGWPGSRAAAWQRAGRAGRRGAPSVVVMVTCSEPLDQYVANDPEYLFGEPPEHGRVDPDNLSVLVPHMKCAAFELPFAAGETFGPLGGDETREVLGYLGRQGLLHEDTARGGFHWIADAYPAQGVPLRGVSDENFTVVDGEGGEVLAEVDYRDAARQLHPNAIYPLEGKLFQVERLDWQAHKAFVRIVDVDYTTEANTYTRVRVIEPLGEAAGAGHGEVHVVEKVVGFKKIKLHTHENVGYGDVSLPDHEIHTRALWFDPPVPDVGPKLAAQLVAGVGRAAFALHHMAALIVLSDVHDLAHAMSDAEDPEVARVQVAVRGGAGLPRIYLYDSMAGGSGLAEKLYEERRTLVARAAKLVAGCACRRGCPACVGAVAEGSGDEQVNGKAAAAAILAAIAARLEERITDAEEVRA